MKRYYFDVGALEGERGAAWLIDNFKDDVAVFAFEPHPEYFQKLKRKYASFGAKYKAFSCAISDKNDKNVKFNLGVGGDCSNGVSSLYEFNQKNIDEKWGNRGSIDLKKGKEVLVETRRLDSVIEEFDINEIEFLHVDAQGADLDVLKSAGKYLNRIVAGRIEVPISANVALYVGQHNKEDCEKFLSENNFSFKDEELQQNEINIAFWRKN